MSNTDSRKLTPDNIVDFIGDILLRRGSDSYLGEPVTMSEHMLQCARLAEAADASEELIAGALLHDIGHYTGEFPEDVLEKGINNHHEATGASVLSPFFPTLVTDCVRWHVEAKRYLCATDPSYFGRLSEASIHTLNLQGGPMNPAEVKAFGDRPHLDAILKVRIWDEGAKVAGISTPDFDHYAPMLIRVVRKAADSAKSHTIN